MSPEQLNEFVTAIEQRVGANLTFQEIRKGLQALSSLYVQKRERITDKALDGAGKRAAFALFYGPLHLMLIGRIVRALGAAEPAPQRIFDLGCGTGAGGAAWAMAAGGTPELYGADAHAWAAGEASWSWRTLGLRGRAEVRRIERVKLPGAGSGVILAFTVNELDEPSRSRLQSGLFEAASRGARILVVEPIARRPLGWWEAWSAAFRERGGRADEWRFSVELPPRLREFDRAAGLDHRELTGRSLYLRTTGEPLLQR